MLKAEPNKKLLNRHANACALLAAYNLSDIDREKIKTSKKIIQAEILEKMKG